MSKETYVDECVMVVEEIDKESIYELRCPGCGQSICEVRPAVVDDGAVFASRCHPCEADLLPHCTVAVDITNDYNQDLYSSLEPGDFEQVVTHFWDRKLTNQDFDVPRGVSLDQMVEHYNNEYQYRANNFGWSWEPSGLYNFL